MMGPPKSGRLFLKTHGDCFLHATAGWLSYASFNLTEERLAIVRVTLPSGQTFYTTLCPTAISYQSVKRGVSREKYLEIDPYFARELGVEYDTQVVVEAVPSVERCAALYLTPKNPDDYETLIESQEKIEYKLLDRIRVVSASFSFPIWTDKTVIPARVVRSEPSASWVLMVPNTRLYIESSAVTSPGATSSIGSLSTPGHSSSQGSGESPDSEESSSNSPFPASFSYMKSLFQQPHPLQRISPDYSAPNTPERKTLPKRHTTTPEPATSSRPHTVGAISPGGGNPSQGKHSRMSSWHAGIDTLEQRLDQALKNRHTVNARITKVVFIGPAGSGKSHLLSALVGEDPGEFRNSTPCAKRGIRAIAHHRALVGKNSSWKLLKPDEFEHIFVKEVHENIEIARPLVDFSGVPRDFVEHLSERSAATVSAPPRDFEELLEHLRERNTATISHSLDGTHWIIFVDTGGQPRYLEVARAFIRNAALNLIVINLTDDLGDVPCDEYYKDGQMICRFGAYNLTNQQLITRLLDAAQSCLNTTRVCGQIPKHPACVLVGTHKDKEHECNESCVAKNEKLTETLQPYRNVIYPKRKARQPGKTEWIFPVNAKPPFTEDQKQLLQDLRDCIMQHSQEKSPSFPLPLAWNALEIRMEMLRGEGQRVISLAQCREIAQALRFPSPDEQTGKDDLLLALEYFDELGLTTYIPDVLKEVLFIDPQLLLDMVSELTASCCRLRADDGKYRLPYTCSAQETGEFTEYGVFTVPLLEKCFSTHYVKGLFTAQNFVDLLTYLLIASPLDDRTHTRYFMPSLLQSSSACIQLSAAPNHTCFLVKLQTCPLGLFCAVVAYMLSNQTKPHLSFFYENVRHLCEHCVTFDCNDYGCTVTLINNDSSLCIEVYVDVSNLDDQELSELCPALKTKVFKGIKEASSKHHYEIDPEIAFFCSSECPSKLPHVAHVIQGKKCMCKDTKKKFPLTKEQAYWMQTLPGMCLPQSSSQSVDPPPCHEKEPGTAGVTSATDYDGPMKPSPSTGTDNLDTIPSLGKLLRFTSSHGKTVNIPQRIGAKYETFGIFLLNDDNGAIVDDLVQKHQRDSVKINLEILKKWIRGEGKKPITWNTLVSCLRDCELSELADEIQQTLT